MNSRFRQELLELIISHSEVCKYLVPCKKGRRSDTIIAIKGEEIRISHEGEAVDDNKVTGDKVIIEFCRYELKNGRESLEVCLKAEEVNNA